MEIGSNTHEEENEKSEEIKKKIQKYVAEKLRKSRRKDIAAKIEACTKHSRCGYESLCPRCRYGLTTRYIKKMIGLKKEIPKLEAMWTKKLNPIIQDINSLMGQIKDKIKGKHFRNDEFSDDISLLLQQTENLESLLNIKPIKEILTKIKRQANKGTVLDRDHLLNELNDIDKTLTKPILSWQYITYTIPRSKKPMKKDYERLRTGFKKIYSDILKSSATGILCFDDIAPSGNNLHTHVIYFGPRIDYNLQGRKWREYTGGNPPECEAIEPELVDMKVNYSTKYVKNDIVAFEDYAEKLVDFWIAIDKQHRVHNYGILKEGNRKERLKEWQRIRRVKKTKRGKPRVRRVIVKK